MVYLCCMRKKSDIIFRRLNREFDLVSYGSIVGAPKNRFIGNNDLVMVKRGDRSNEIYLHITNSEIRLSPSFHSRYFGECSFAYFKTHLKTFLTNCSGNDYVYYRFVKYDFDGHSFFNGITFSPSNGDKRDVVKPRKRVANRGQMRVVWKNPKKVSRNLANPLRISA